MYFWFTIVLILLSFAAHEAGHAHFMRKHGVMIEDAGFGFGPTLFTLHPRRLGYPIRFKLLPLGAYVRPFESEADYINELPYRKQAVIYGAGPIGNFIYALLIVGGFRAAQAVSVDYANSWYAQKAAIYLAIAAALWFGQKLISPYLLPLLGLVALVLVTTAVVQAPRESATGPVGIVRQTQEQTGKDTSKLAKSPDTAYMAGASQMSRSLGMVASVSIGVGLLNLLPLSVLDGGRLYAALLRLWSERAVRVFQHSTTVVLVLFIAFVWLGDLARL